MIYNETRNIIFSYSTEILTTLFLKIMFTFHFIKNILFLLEKLCLFIPILQKKLFLNTRYDFVLFFYMYNVHGFSQCTNVDMSQITQKKMINIDTSARIYKEMSISISKKLQGLLKGLHHSSKTRIKHKNGIRSK